MWIHFLGSRSNGARPPVEPLRGERIMKLKHGLRVLLLSLGVSTSAVAASSTGYPGGHRDALGQQYGPQPGIAAAANAHAPMSPLAHWNAIAVDASGLDHTP